jgi:hypothetical protein
MMRERLLALAERRARLVASAQAERETLSGMLVPVDAAASFAASLVRVARGLLDQAARYPLAVIAGMAFLVALRPKRTVVWLSRGWSLWRLYRGARGWWLRFAAPASRNAGAPAGAPR